MKLRNVLIVFTILCCVELSAQEFAVGIKGGLNTNSIGDINSRGGSFETGHPDELFSPNKEIGYQFGAFLNIEFGKFFIRPEINYVQLNNSYSFPQAETSWSASKTDIPILLGYRIIGPIAPYVGFGFNLYGDVKMESANNTPGKTNINYFNSTTTLNFGINVEFKRFGIDLRYEMGNTETEEELQDFIFSGNGATGVNLADILPYKPSQFSLSVNIFLFRTNADDIGGLFSGLFKGKCHCPYTK